MEDAGQIIGGYVFSGFKLEVTENAFGRKISVIGADGGIIANCDVRRKELEEAALALEQAARRA